MEPCVAITIRGDAKNKRLPPVVEERKCLHLYHYYEHPVFGRLPSALAKLVSFYGRCLLERVRLASQTDEC
jgi:hypothetical protein